MKKMMMVAFALMVSASMAMAQTYTKGSGITGIDKLGAHQNGGRGCVGCHAPHSGARGNGGSLTLGATYNGTTKKWSAGSTINGTVGDDALWGQDYTAILALGHVDTGDAGSFKADFSLAESTQPRMLTGVAYCLSCHDGNVSKGAMMTNASFEQAAGLLPSTYGSQTIPTLLGDDGGTTPGNYENDHPIGQGANIGTLSISGYLQFDNASAPSRLNLATTQPNANYTTFQTNYGLPLVAGARTGAGFAVESTMTNVKQAYVVCTTCHTPHSMYTASAGNTNPIDGATAGTYPSYFFIAAPYNPGANTAGGTMASSATQFCRQCHFSGAGGANESAGIMTIKTAF